MKAFFIGSLYPAERTEEIVQNCKPGGIGNAANNLQWALIKGLDHFYEDLTIITQPNLRPFPKYYKKPVVKKSNFSHISGAKDYCLGYINIHGIKHLSRYLGLRKKLRNIIPRNKEAIVIIYALSSPFIKAVADLKNNGWHQLKTCVIVPDLPQFMRETSNSFYRAYKRIDMSVIKKGINSIDSFVLLSKYMVDDLSINCKPWIVVEGVFSENIVEPVSKKESNKTILYSGTLDLRSGIKNLLDAFCLLKNLNYHLWICGHGEAISIIQKYASKDSRIKFFGQLPNQKVKEMQRKATVLINPRASDGVFTKYSFPSKTIEYLASGTPTIINRLPGIPDEYFKHAFVPRDESVKGLRDCIAYVCSLDDEMLKEFGEKAKKFIQEDKNSIAQARKIYEMISSL